VENHQHLTARGNDLSLHFPSQVKIVSISKYGSCICVFKLRADLFNMIDNIYEEDFFSNNLYTLMIFPSGQAFRKLAIQGTYSKWYLVVVTFVAKFVLSGV